MSVAKRVSEDRARFGSHRTRGGGSVALALDDLAAPVGRWRRPGDDQDANRAVVCSLPRASLLLELNSASYPVDCEGLGRCELGPVSQHRVHDDCEATRQSGLSPFASSTAWRSRRPSP